MALRCLAAAAIRLGRWRRFNFLLQGEKKTLSRNTKDYDIWLIHCQMLGRTGSFWPAEAWKSRRGSRFCREIAKTKTENGNYPSDVVILLVLSSYRSFISFSRRKQAAPSRAALLQIIRK